MPPTVDAPAVVVDAAAAAAPFMFICCCCCRWGSLKELVVRRLLIVVCRNLVSGARFDLRTELAVFRSKMGVAVVPVDIIFLLDDDDDDGGNAKIDHQSSITGVLLVGGVQHEKVLGRVPSDSIIFFPVSEDSASPTLLGVVTERKSPDPSVLSAWTAGFWEK